MDLSKIRILVTLLFLVPIVGFAISSYFFVRSQEDKWSVLTGLFSFSVSLLLFCSVEFSLQDDLLTQDIHQGDVFSLPILSPEMKKDIAGGYSYSFDFSVGQITDSLECHQRWYIGQNVHYVFNGSPFSMTVLGRATEPDYRYLLSLDSWFDFSCIKSVFVTNHQLADIKTTWKKAWTISRMPGNTNSSDVELRSVQPLATGPQNILAHSAH